MFDTEFVCISSFQMPTHWSLIVKEIQPTYKAKLRDSNGEESSKAFEDLVTWCLNSEIEKLKEAFNKDIYKDILFKHYPPYVDIQTDYNLTEFAAISGDVEVMKILPKKHMGNSLSIASSRDDLEMVKYLLSLRYDLHYDVASSIPPAVNGGNFEIVSLLVDKLKHLEDTKAKCFKKDHPTIKRYIDFHGALIIAVKKQRLDLVKLLVANDADPTIGIVDAVEMKNYDIVECLVENGAGLFLPFLIHVNLSLPEYIKKKMNEDDIEFEKIAKYLAVKISSKQENVPLNHISRIWLLQFQRNQDVLANHEKEDNFRELVLHCLNGNISEITHEKYGSYLKMNYHDLHTGYRPIDFAVLQGNVKLVKHLISLGAESETEESFPKSKDVLNYFGSVKSAIDLAFDKDQNEVAKCLLENCVKPEKQLFFAIEKDQLDFAKDILENNDNLDIDAYCQGITALQLASLEGKLEYVQLLVNYGSDINKSSLPGKHCHYGAEISYSGMSSLHFAALNGYYEVVEYLIDHGADVLKKDSKQKKAIDLIQTKLVKSESEQKMMKLLESKMKSLKSNDRKRKKSEKNASADKLGNLQESSRYGSGVVSSSNEHKAKSKRTKTTDDSTCTSHAQSNKETPKESRNPEEIAFVVQPLLESFMNSNFSRKTKMICLSAIELVIAKDIKACDSILKKEFVDEIANIVEEIVNKECSEVDKDLLVIAKIFAKLEQRNSEGKKLIGGMKMSFSAFDRLRTEMKKVEILSNPGDFAFDSDRNINMKTEVTELCQE